MTRKLDNSAASVQVAPLRSLAEGTFFKRKPDAARVYVRGEYIRGANKYSCYWFDDVNREILLSGDTVVTVGFDF